MSIVKIGRAVISVSDKTGLSRLGRELDKHGVELISSSGTARALREEGLLVGDVSDITGLPEMMDGRIKTLHPKIHGGLLAELDNEEHLAKMNEHNIQSIHLLVVNLYPFGEPGAMARAPYKEAVELIDIGGPAMIRAAAKNHKFVTVITDPNDYDALYAMLNEHDGGTTLEYRQQCMAAAFEHTAAYDTRIAQSFRKRFPKKKAAEPAHPKTW